MQNFDEGIFLSVFSKKSLHSLRYGIIFFEKNGKKIDRQKLHLLFFHSLI